MARYPANLRCGCGVFHGWAGTRQTMSFINCLELMRRGARRWALAALLLVPASAACAETTLLNASYDPTRRFYSAVNDAFSARWKAEHGDRITIYQSHTGSGAQA